MRQTKKAFQVLENDPTQLTASYQEQYFSKIEEEKCQVGDTKHTRFYTQTTCCAIRVVNKLAQSKFDSYQQMQFTSVDDIDDAIVKVGAKSLLRNYSQKIMKYKKMNDSIPRAVNALNAVVKRNNQSDLSNNFQQMSGQIAAGSNSTK